MRKRFALFIMAAGILLIFVYQLSNFVVTDFSSDAVTVVDNLPVEALKLNVEKDASYDYSSVQELTPTMTLLTSKDLDPSALIGKIVIPELDIYLPLINGVSDTNLLAGVVTMKANQIMGEGNYALAGHYHPSDGYLLNSLLKIEKGMVVRITNRETVYEYTIYDTQIVPDDSIDMIEDERSEIVGKPIISIMTCYYTSKNGKRFFALGELTNTYPYDMETFTELN